MVVNEPLKKAIEELKDEELKHYGVLGMRWGVRRPVGGDGLVTGSVKSAMRNMKNLTNVRNKNLKAMSDDELKSKVDRLTKENRLKSLSIAKEDKRAYRSRGDLSDQELTARVDRLQLEATLRSQSFKANKEAIDQVNDLMKEISKKAIKELDDVKVSENATTDFLIKQTVKKATKDIRDGKMIKTK